MKNTKLENIKILLVDDDPRIKEGLVALLDLRASQVTLCRNGQSAIPTYKTLVEIGEAPDVVIVDMHLSKAFDQAGLRVIADLRRAYNVSIIALTADTGNHELQTAAINAGADTFISKPMTASKLHTALDIVLYHGDSRGILLQFLIDVERLTDAALKLAKKNPHAVEAQIIVDVVRSIKKKLGRFGA